MKTYISSNNHQAFSKLLLEFQVRGECKVTVLICVGSAGSITADLDIDTKTLF